VLQFLRDLVVPEAVLAEVYDVESQPVLYFALA
jgi:hypothetical protein